MLTRFWKMHGLGNDFVILHAEEAPVTRIADRRHGIGCDQVILLSDDSHGQVGEARAAFFNPDGSRAGACGNGTRCVADLLMRQHKQHQTVVYTDGGRLLAERDADGRVRVDMGAPHTLWHEIPLAFECDTLHVPLSRGALADGVACSMGNPHLTFFVPNAEWADMADAAGLECDPMFPERANIGVASFRADGLRLRVWERGAGLTEACGSGACAAAVAAMRLGLCGRSVTVHMDGGAVDVAWGDDGDVIQTGPVAMVFEGTIDLDTLR